MTKLILKNLTVIPKLIRNDVDLFNSKRLPNTVRVSTGSGDLYEMSSGVDLEGITLESFTGKPKVSYWVPRKEEIQRLAQIAKGLHEGEGLPRILDIGCGNGFVSCLLAQEGCNVVGYDPNQQLLESTVYRHPNITYKVGTAKTAMQDLQGGGIDLVLCSMMPFGRNLTPDIQAIHPKGIAYVIYEGETGVQDGMEHITQMTLTEGLELEKELKKGKSYDPGDEYNPYLKWDTSTWINLTGRNHKKSWVEIQIRRDIAFAKSFSSNITDAKYPWERLLNDYKAQPSH